jgi:hypothetical protein
MDPSGTKLGSGWTDPLSGESAQEVPAFATADYPSTLAPAPNPQQGVGGGAVDDDFVGRQSANFSSVLIQRFDVNRYRTIIFYNYMNTAGITVSIYASNTVDPSNLLAIIGIQTWKSIPLPSGCAQLTMVASATDPATNVFIGCAALMSPFSGSV